jgi:hypothetical protein
MTAATWSAPKSRAAPFRDADGEIGAGPGRRRRDRRTGCRRETEDQRRTKNHCSNHQSLLIFNDRLCQPIPKPAGAKLSSNMTKTMTPTIGRRFFIQMNGLS